MLCTVAEVTVRVGQAVGGSADAAAERKGGRELLVRVKAAAKQSTVGRGGGRMFWLRPIFEPICVCFAVLTGWYSLGLGLGRQC